MTRRQFTSFLRTLIATLLTGVILWLFHRLGVGVSLPSSTPTFP